jgi:hypothetical protein
MYCLWENDLDGLVTVSLPSVASSRQQGSPTLAPRRRHLSPPPRPLVVSRGRRWLSRPPPMKGAARPYASRDLARSSRKEDAVLGPQRSSPSFAPTAPLAGLAATSYSLSDDARPWRDLAGRALRREDCSGRA